MKDQVAMDKFVKKCPFAVLTQFAIRGLLRDELDGIFHEHRSRQYEREQLFSDVALAVADVALGHVDNFNQAYVKHKEDLRVSRTCFYEKINRTECAISEAIVERSAQRASDMQDEMGYRPWEILPGYEVVSLDGNHLQESDKRLEVLQDAYDAPLPGTVVARFDHQRQLLDRVYLLQDAHAQESTVHDRVLKDLHANSLLIADRHHCVLAFLNGIAELEASFLIRQHGRFKGVLLGDRKKIGETSRGLVYEQKIATSNSSDALVMRRITIELYRPTEKGENEVHLLTNLPVTISTLKISDIYLLRWEIENAFYYLSTSFTCERKSIGNPPAALFLFCMAAVAFNIRQIVFAAMYAAHSDEDVENLSNYRISKEISQYTEGMLVILDEEAWGNLLPGKPCEIAVRMCDIAASIKVSEYSKAKRSPKKKKTKKPKPKRSRTHMSTAKALAERRP